MPEEETDRVTMLWPVELKEAVREEVGPRGLTTFTVAAVRAKLGTHDSHKEDSKELNEVRFLVQRLADSIALGGDYEDRESTLREIDLPPWVDTTGWPEHLARAINPEESTPEPVPGSEAGIKGMMNHLGMTQEGDGTKVIIDDREVEQTYFQADHPFEPSYTGMVCEAMVMRDGGGDQCGLPAEAHAKADEEDEDLHRPMAFTGRPKSGKSPMPASPAIVEQFAGVGDIVLSEPPKTSGASLMDRVRAKAQEKGVDLSGVDLKPASDVRVLSTEERDAKLEQIRGVENEIVRVPEVHNHSWARLEDPHGIYPSKAYVCDCGATMSSERVYPPGEAPAPLDGPSGLSVDDDDQAAESEVTTEQAVELEVQAEVPSPVAGSNVCPKCQSELVGDECWECF